MNLLDKIQEKQIGGGFLSKCVKRVRDFYIEEIVREDVPRAEAEEEVDREIDWVELESDLREGAYGLSPIESDERASRALSIVSSKAPNLYQKILSRTFILSRDFHTRYATTAPMYIDDRRLVAVIVPGYYLEVLSPEALAASLAHEAIHIDMDEDPEKYGFDKTKYTVYKMTGLIEEQIWGRLEKLGLNGEIHKRETYKAEEHGWKVSRWKIWPETQVLRIVACWKGRESKPRWEV